MAKIFESFKEAYINETQNFRKLSKKFGELDKQRYEDVKGTIIKDTMQDFLKQIEQNSGILFNYDWQGILRLNSYTIPKGYNEIQVYWAVQEFFKKYNIEAKLQQDRGGSNELHIFPNTFVE